MRACLLGLVLMLSGGCGVSVNLPAPLAPPRPPKLARALFTMVGPHQWAACVATDTGAFCTLEVALQNTGPGCAVAVAGVVRLLTATGQQHGDAAPFAWPSQQLVVPAEVLTVRVPFVPLVTARAITSVLVTPTWSDTPCHQK